MKVNVGSSKLKSSFFPISFDSSTTTNFGECVPVFAHELPPGAHLNIDMRSAVRFAPLSLPTFGKAYLHSYAYCHSIKDLWCPFDDFLAQTPYTAGNGNTYIPTQVPSVPMVLFWHMVLSHADFSVISGIKLQGTSSSPVTFEQMDFNNVKVTWPTEGSASLDGGLTYTLLKSTLLTLGSGLASYVTSVTNYLLSSSRSDNFFSSSKSMISRYNPDVTPGSSDFIVPLGSNVLYYLNNSNVYGTVNLPALEGNNTYYLCIRLNNAGKFLRKILLGLGYQLSPQAKPVSVLPLFAFFRSYFDTFAPKRFIKYDQTYFGKYMVELVNSGVGFLSVATNPSYHSGLSGLVDDLLSCYYTKDTDYYSAQIIGMINDYGSSLNRSYVGLDESDDPSEATIYSYPQSNSGPSIALYDPTMQHTQAQQNILSRLTEFVNRRSVLGGKIADLLESVFGIKKKEVMDDNPYLGSSVIDVDFSDVFSTAETTEASLGEYAGKAIGVGSSDRLSVSVDIHSIVICFSVLVPRTQYVQGVNPNLFHVSPSDYYNPQFDGLTLLPTDKLSLVAPSSPWIDQPGDSFGNLPLYTEYKTKSQGILSGDLSLLSTKSSYDSFTMDETFSDYVYVGDPVGSNFDGHISFVKPFVSSCVNGTMWRYIGRWIWLGNFDRIFVNNRNTLDDQFYRQLYQTLGYITRDIFRSDDNLIVHNIVDLKINAPMLPLADSFMTKDLNELENGVGVKAQSE